MKRKTFRWDEQKLAETEAGKDSTMKIVEPKTPFLTYNSDLDISTAQGVPFLMLTNALESANVIEQEDGENLIHSGEGYWEKEGDSTDDSGIEEGGSPKRRFAEMRQSHYKMKNVLLRAREQVDNENEIDGYNDPEFFTGQETSHGRKVESSSEEEVEVQRFGHGNSNYNEKFIKPIKSAMKNNNVKDNTARVELDDNIDTQVQPKIKSAMKKTSTGITSEPKVMIKSALKKRL